VRYCSITELAPSLDEDIEVAQFKGACSCGSAEFVAACNHSPERLSRRCVAFKVQCFAIATFSIFLSLIFSFDFVHGYMLELQKGSAAALESWLSM